MTFTFRGYTLQLGRVPWLLALLALALGTSSCEPRRADASDTGAVTMSVVASVAGDTIAVTTAFKPGSDDGKGGLDGFLVITQTGTGAPKALKDSVSLGSSARTHTARWTGNPPGTYTGTACVTARRRLLNSTPTCRTWSVVIVDTPPPPPIVDSVKVLALRLLPGTFTVARSGRFKLCLAAEFPNGGAGLWGDHEDNPECQARLAAAYPSRRALTSAESTYLALSENCYPTDGQNPSNGTICKRRGTPS